MTAGVYPVYAGAYPMYAGVYPVYADVYPVYAGVYRELGEQGVKHQQSISELQSADQKNKTFDVEIVTSR